MRITLFDYGAGNLHSLSKALTAPDREVRIERDPFEALETSLLVLPGVGAFAPAAARLAPALAAWRTAIAGGLPLLGVCLGMQLMFDASDEGPGDGLGLFAGRVTRLRASRLPQIGWNAVDAPRGAAFATDLPPVAYYANSFACRPRDERCVIGWSVHEDDRFPAAIRIDRVVGVQFHPEKSSLPGVRFLDRVVRSIALPSLPLTVSP